MSEFRMPSLGADMDEGTVLEWLVKPGDVVKKGDIVAVVDTAKSAVDVETFESGIVERILVEAGGRVPVGTPLAIIGAAEAAAPEPAPAPAPAPARPAKRKKKAARPVPVPVEKAAVPGADRASPVVRRFARTAGVDLATVRGTGPNGRITHDDVRRAMPAPAPAAPAAPAAAPAAPVPAAHGRPRISPYARRRARELGVDPADLVALAQEAPVQAADVAAAAARRPTAEVKTAEGKPAEVKAAEVATATTVPAPRAAPTAAERAAAMRQAIATLMARSKREVPHYYLTETFDLSAAQAWLREHNTGLPVGQRLVMAALLAKATAVAARRVPQLNGFWVDGAFQPAPSVHLGVAVSLRGGGLVTPAIHDAADLTLPDLMAALRDLVERSRRGVLHRAELTDGTLTMTNLGERGAESVLGVIFPPQVALVGFGRVVERPVAVDGLLGVHPTVHATLSGDHRASDGHVGGTFLATVGELLERPEEL
ncbi:MAG: 2-oxo acid dehydrogenase subunit E2 [Actinomycetes bacterium]